MEGDFSRFLLLEENSFVTSMVIDTEPCSCPRPTVDGNCDAPGTNPLQYDSPMHDEETPGMQIPAQWAPDILSNSRGEIPLFSNRNPTTASAASEGMVPGDASAEQPPAAKNRAMRKRVNSRNTRERRKHYEEELEQMKTRLESEHAAAKHAVYVLSLENANLKRMHAEVMSQLGLAQARYQHQSRCHSPAQRQRLQVKHRGVPPTAADQTGGKFPASTAAAVTAAAGARSFPRFDPLTTATAAAAPALLLSCPWQGASTTTDSALSTPLDSDTIPAVTVTATTSITSSSACASGCTTDTEESRRYYQLPRRQSHTQQPAARFLLSYPRTLLEDTAALATQQQQQLLSVSSRSGCQHELTLQQRRSQPPLDLRRRPLLAASRCHHHWSAGSLAHEGAPCDCSY